MADNVTTSAATFATDDIGSVQYQRVKVTYGADGSATDASSSNPLPVKQPLPSAATAFGPPATQPTTTRQTLCGSVAGRNSVEIANNGSQVLYVGDGTVTTANGYPIPPGGSKVFYVTGALYGVVSSGTADARIWDE